MIYELKINKICTEMWKSSGKFEKSKKFKNNYKDFFKKLGKF